MFNPMKNSPSKVIVKGVAKGVATLRERSQRKCSQTTRTQILEWKECLEAFIGCPTENAKSTKPTEALQQDMELWMDVQYLRDIWWQAERAAEVYYQPDKLQDRLSRFAQFVHSIKPDEDPALVRLKGYSNYIFFMQEYMAKLQARYQPQPIEQLLQSRPDPTLEDRLRFIRNECRNITEVQSIPDTLPLCNQLLADCDDEYLPVSEADKELIQTTYDLCKKPKLKKESIERLKTVKESLDKQKEEIIKGLETINNLHGKLTRALTPEWFAKVNLPDPPEMTTDAIKEVYLSALSELKELLPHT